MEITTTIEEQTVIFKLQSGSLQARVVIYEPYLNSKESWLQLVAAVRTQTHCHLNFYQGNGDGSIICDGNQLIFFAQPSGAGGDVCVETMIPANEQAAEALMVVVDNYDVLKVSDD